MGTNPTLITHDFAPFFRIHSTGRVERYREHDFVPPSEDHQTGVVSKDVIISPENQVSTRIFLPKRTKSDPRIPLLIYIHGGAFTLESTFSSLYHHYLNSLASESGFLIVSIEYRLAPEHLIPACYDDSWAVLKWVESHSSAGQGSDPWIKQYADLDRIYLAGDSAGANIAHYMVVRASDPDPNGEKLSLKIEGLVLIHPFFGNEKGDRLWRYICPDSPGPNDPRLNPAANMDILSNLKCEKLLVCVAEKDFLKDRGVKYHEALVKSGWKGVVEFCETPGEGHVFHLFDPTSETAASLMKRVVGFVDGAQESNEILHEFPPLLRQYKDGRIERLAGTDFVPASVDPVTGVQSRDVVIAPEINVWARIFLPPNADRSKKLPVLVYFHGGGFMVESAGTPLFHAHLNSLAAEANVMGVSVTYRKAPEHPLPAAHDDSWLAVEWVASHSKNNGCSNPDEWIRDYADLDRIYFAGDSAGGNIAHHMALKVGIENLEGINLRGVFLNCPFFWGNDPVGNEGPDVMGVHKAWHFVCPHSSGCDDPMLNPAKDPNLPRFGCKKVLVCAAEHDFLRERDQHYVQLMKNCGWDGEIELVDVEGEGHDFCVFHPTKEKSVAMIKRVAAFLNGK